MDKVGISLNEHSAPLPLEMFYTDFLYRQVAHDILKLYGKMCGLSNGTTGQQNGLQRGDFVLGSFTIHPSK